MTARQARPKRRVSPLTRERARERMLALPEAEKQRRLEAMRKGRERKRSPERLAEVEARLDELGARLRETEDHTERWEIRHELRDLGNERLELKWT